MLNSVKVVSQSLFSLKLALLGNLALADILIKSGLFILKF